MEILNILLESTGGVGQYSVYNQGKSAGRKLQGTLI